MKRSRIAPILLCIGLWTTSLQAYSGGAGTAGDPYQIATAEDLIALGQTPDDYNKHFILTADIDLAGYTFDRAVIVPISSSSLRQGRPPKAFNGVFEGDDHVVRHLDIKGVDNLGLFGRLGVHAHICNLSLENSSVYGTGRFIGGLAGINEGIVSTCRSTAQVVGEKVLPPGEEGAAGMDRPRRGKRVGPRERCVGGLVGENFGQMSNCYNAGEVTGYNAVGGVAGLNGHSMVNCHNTGTVLGNLHVGGLVGFTAFGSRVSDCINSGTVRGKSQVAGLVGLCQGSTLNSFSSGIVAAKGDYAGGLVGANSGSVLNCYSTGDAAGATYVGGLVGCNSRSVANCYSTGKVTGNEHVGGLVGRNFACVQRSFWNKETSDLGSSSGGVGLMTADMQGVDTYSKAGWDLADAGASGRSEVWRMLEAKGYPRLSRLEGYTPIQPRGRGTATEPFLVTNIQELVSVGYRPLAHYRLEVDLDFSKTCWSAAVVPWFGGCFDGNGHVIAHLNIHGAGHLGLFGALGKEAEISNLTLLNGFVQGTGDFVGLLVARGSGNLTNCPGTGAVIGANYVGGLIGYSHMSMSGCRFSGEVMGTQNVGGMAGDNHTDIVNSRSDARVAGRDDVGGLIGVNHGSVSNCWSTGEVKGQRREIGGLIGRNSGGEVSICHADEKVTGSDEVGGLVGDNSGIISRCHSRGVVTGRVNAGGLVGRNYQGSISNCYSRCTVGGGDRVGGLVGDNHNAQVSYSYSTGAVAGNECIGGLIGESSGRVVTSWWDVDSSGIAVSAGGLGLVTTRMQDHDTYMTAGWDFVDETDNGVEDLWWMPAGDYPRLWWEVSEGQ